LFLSNCDGRGRVILSNGSFLFDLGRNIDLGFAS
jgi:hypothetical protein